MLNSEVPYVRYLDRSDHEDVRLHQPRCHNASAYGLRGYVDNTPPSRCYAITTILRVHRKILKLLRSPTHPYGSTPRERPGPLYGEDPLGFKTPSWVAPSRPPHEEEPVTLYRPLLTLDLVSYLCVHRSSACVIYPCWLSDFSHVPLMFPSCFPSCSSRSS